MIISKTDNIPTKKVVSVLGNISISQTEWLENDETKAMNKLKTKAQAMGANAIINFVYSPSAPGMIKATASGLAVIVEDKTNSQTVPPTPPSKQGYKYCYACGEKIPISFGFCGKCGIEQPRT